MNKITFKKVKMVVFLISLSILAYFSTQVIKNAGASTNQDSSVVDMGMANVHPDEKSYVLGSANLIYIKVLGEEGLQQTFRVDEIGFITHPLLGRVRLGGKTISEAEVMLKDMLSKDYILNPNVTIFVLEHSRFSVLGEVRKPGNYEILGKLSLIEGISIAGGFTPVANQKKIKVLRHEESGEKTIIMNVRDVMDGKQDDFNIEAGDVIEVPVSFL